MSLAKVLLIYSGWEYSYNATGVGGKVVVGHKQYRLRMKLRRYEVRDRSDGGVAWRGVAGRSRLP